MQSPKLAPTYVGFIGTPKDALLVIQATLNGQLQSVPRRPHDRERLLLIHSGNVFVFIEELLGIKRWTDGVAWLPSRILGRFLVYRELDRDHAPHKGGKREKARAVAPKGRRRGKREHEAPMPPVGALMGLSASGALDKEYLNSSQGRSLVGLLVASYAFKEKGLIKKTLSLQYHDETIHLVLYYTCEDALVNRLVKPLQSELDNVQISQDLWNAVKELLLGGKVPVDEELHFYLEASYGGPPPPPGMAPPPPAPAAPLLHYHQPQFPNPMQYGQYPQPYPPWGMQQLPVPIGPPADGYEYPHGAPQTPLMGFYHPQMAPPPVFLAKNRLVYSPTHRPKLPEPLQPPFPTMLVPAPSGEWYTYSGSKPPGGAGALAPLSLQQPFPHTLPPFPQPSQGAYGRPVPVPPQTPTTTESHPYQPAQAIASDLSG